MGIKLLDKLEVENRRIEGIKKLDTRRLDLSRYGITSEQIERYHD